MTLDPDRVQELIKQHPELRLERKGDNIFFTPLRRPPESVITELRASGPPYLSAKSNRWEIKSGSEESRLLWIVKLNGLDEEPEQPSEYEEEEEEEDKAEAKKEDAKPEAPKPVETAPKAEPERPAQGSQGRRKRGGGGEGGQKSKDTQDLQRMMLMSDEIDSSMSKDDACAKLGVKYWPKPRGKNPPKAVMVVPGLLGEFFLACFITKENSSKEVYSVTAEEKKCTALLPWSVPMTYCFRDGKCRLGFGCSKDPEEKKVEQILDNVLNVLARRKVLIYRASRAVGEKGPYGLRGCTAIVSRDRHCMYVIIQRRDDTPEKPHEIEKLLGRDFRFERSEVLHKLW